MIGQAVRGLLLVMALLWIVVTLAASAIALMLLCGVIPMERGAQAAQALTFCHHASYPLLALASVAYAFLAYPGALVITALNESSRHAQELRRP